jgi:hypothetical protein
LLFLSRKTNDFHDVLIVRALHISQKAHFQAILTSKEIQKMIVFLSEMKVFCKSTENDKKILFLLSQQKQVFCHFFRLLLKLADHGYFQKTFVFLCKMKVFCGWGGLHSKKNGCFCDHSKENSFSLLFLSGFPGS